MEVIKSFKYMVGEEQLHSAEPDTVRTFKYKRAFRNKVERGESAEIRS